MRRLLPLAVLLSLSSPAFAWNPHGHRVVAAIAYQKLTPAVRGRVDALLKLNPDHRRWIQGVSAADHGLVAFMRASNWADDIREAPGYVRDAPEVARAAPRIGYRDRNKHEHWHYTNKPFSPDGTRVRASQVPNVQTQIAALRRGLASNSSDEQRSYDLVWLLHLVGDVHQPLHCSARFTRQQPDGDRGGTWIALSSDPKDHLHRFWDATLGDNLDPKEARIAAAKLRPAPPALELVSDEAAWVNEGWQEAQLSVYVKPVGPGVGPYTLDQPYQRRAREISEARIALAGARLARLLNEALK